MGERLDSLHLDATLAQQRARLPFKLGPIIDAKHSDMAPACFKLVDDIV